MGVVWFEIFLREKMRRVVCGASGDFAECLMDSFEGVGVGDRRGG